MVFDKVSPPAVSRAFVPNVWDAVAFVLVVGAMVHIVHGARETTASLTALNTTSVSLDPANLPEYALRTTLRMLAAIVCSLIFTFVYATIGAKSRRAEMVLIPILDILQSVPILGFLTFTVVFFMGLFPGEVLGAELAAVFAIFTSQAWNMTFSMYQSLRNVPKDLEEASASFHLSTWQRFWRLDVPFATPGLVWNTMMSMSGGWFFVVASEAITVGDTTVTLPGIGSYVALAIKEQDLTAVGFAVLTMLVIILAYDQLLFRPIVTWADKFRFEQTASSSAPTSWVLDMFRRTRALRALSHCRRTLPDARLGCPPAFPALAGPAPWAWFTLPVGGWAVAGDPAGRNGLRRLENYRLCPRHPDARRYGDSGWHGADHAVARGCAHRPGDARVGADRCLDRPRPKLAEKIQPLAQFLAAFPANILFPAAVVVIVHYRLDPNVWLSPLMILGTQWYILFNVIAGASVFPSDLKEVAQSFHVKRWRWWRNVILPGIFPYYITGAITASGGSWNASIVAEVANWGDTTLTAVGLGSDIAQATEAGDFHRVLLGIAVMSVFVTLSNRLLWRPLYGFAERRLRLG